MTRAVLLVLALLVAGCADNAAGEGPDADVTGSPAAETFVTTTTESSDEPVALEPTPAQAEGPFYPVEKPSDRDNDLTEIDGQPGVAQGQVLIISGLLLDTEGQPLAGATVEIWQTDANGIYLHPDDPNVAERDQVFQGYGESITQAGGEWAFRTIKPGKYEPRPRHIHLKVIVDEIEVLTSQIYFADDPDAADLPESLVAEVVIDDDGESLLAEHRLVIGG